MQARPNASLRHLVEASIRRMRAAPIVSRHDLKRLDEDNCAWVRDQAIAQDRLSTYARIRVAQCAALTYCSSSPEVARFGADLVGWLFLFDDRYGEGQPDDTQGTLIDRFASFAMVLENAPPPPPITPFHESLADLVARGRARGGAGWSHRFALDMMRYFVGCVLELPYRRGQSAPTIEEYRRIRVGSVGTLAVFDVIELGQSRVLTEEEAALPSLIAAKERAALLTAWVNDVYSFPKELAAGDPLNLIATLEREYGLTVEEAFGAASEVYNEDLRLLELDSERAVDESGGSDAVRAFMRGLHEWVDGNHEWTGSCGRYV
jgi:hypothetical protein